MEKMKTLKLYYFYHKLEYDELKMNYTIFKVK
jgi:hypothetical protein